MTKYTVDDLKKYIEKQKARFLNTIYINLVLIVGVLLFLAVNIYSSIDDINNPAPVRLFLYVILIFLFVLVIWALIHNIIGIIYLNKLDKLIKSENFLPSDLISFNTRLIFYGSFYRIIEDCISDITKVKHYHNLVKKKNLAFLNIKLAIISFVILMFGLSLFISEVIYFKNDLNFKDHWELIFTLISMIVVIIFVLLYLVPRQIIINIKSRLDDKKMIDEYDYFFKFRIFCIKNTMGKLWNQRESELEIIK